MRARALPRIVLAGDPAHLGSVAPWAARVLSKRARSVAAIAAPDVGAMGERLGRELDRVGPTDLVVIILGGAHAREPGPLPSLGPILAAVRRRGARLVWALSPGLSAESPSKAREIESAVESAGEVAVDACAGTLDLRAGALTPPAARRLLVAIGKALPDVADTSDLSDAFFSLGDAMTKRLGIDFVHLLYAMNFESGVRSSAENPASHAVGLIQFAGPTLSGLYPGTKDQFKALSAEEQLPYVERYFAPYKAKRLDSAARVYQAMLVPATLDDPSPVVLARDGTRSWPDGTEANFYAANAAAWDPKATGAITVDGIDQGLRAAATSLRFRTILARYSALSGRALPGITPSNPQKVSLLGPLVGAFGVPLVGLGLLWLLENRGKAAPRSSAA